MWDGVANLRALSEYERALLAGDPETPAEAIRELSSDNSLMVASSIAGNWSASTGDLKVVLAHHPELCEFVAANPNAPLGVIEDSPIGSLGSSVLQSYMDRIAASPEQWARVNSALATSPVPGGPRLSEILGIHSRE